MYERVYIGLAPEEGGDKLGSLMDIVYAKG